jgi:hypothetical protein
MIGYFGVWENEWLDIWMVGYLNVGHSDGFMDY